MNRFKVKAKLLEGDLTGNRWVHGYYVFLNNKHCIITDQGGLSYPEQIHPDTICRCLDRFDIHGELIYENDHIRSGEVVGNHLDYKNTAVDQDTFIITINDGKTHSNV